jgi:hypothetical protein
MKMLKSLFILSALALGNNVYSQELLMPSFSDIKTIKLHTGEVINAEKEITLIQLASDRINKVDYIELKEGLIIDSYDIKEIKFNQNFENSILNRNGMNSQLLIRAVMGDGSGG